MTCGDLTGKEIQTKSGYTRTRTRREIQAKSGYTRTPNPEGDPNKEWVHADTYLGGRSKQRAGTREHITGLVYCTAEIDTTL